MNEICQYLGRQLSREAKNRLSFCLNTVKLCNKDYYILPEVCIAKLRDYNEILQTRIRHLGSYPGTADDVIKFESEVQNNLEAIEQIRRYMED